MSMNTSKNMSTTEAKEFQVRKIEVQKFEMKGQITK